MTPEQAIAHIRKSNWVRTGKGIRADLVNAGYVLVERNAELEFRIKRLEHGYQRRGIEGDSCPGCKFENGVFLELCQLHKDMEWRDGQIEKRDSEIERLRAVAKAVLHELENCDRSIALELFCTTENGELVVVDMLRQALKSEGDSE